MTNEADMVDGAAAAFEDNGERYPIVVRRGRSVFGRYGELMWPCYA